MSYKEEFASNNTDLQAILDKVNALPEAGASYGTCTVKITGYRYWGCMWCTKVENGEIVHHGDCAYGTLLAPDRNEGNGENAVFYFDNVLCNSLFALAVEGGAEIRNPSGGMTQLSGHTFITPLESGSVGGIECGSEEGGIGDDDI
jgi:hypothetical protein